MKANTTTGRLGNLVSITAWASLAGVLFSQAYLNDGRWAWLGVIAMGVAIFQAGKAQRWSHGYILAGTVSQIWVGVHCWGFVQYGWGLFVFTILYQALSGALWGLLMALLARNRRGEAKPVGPIEVGLTYMTVEYAHQLGSFGFPLFLGGTQVGLPFAQAMSVVGAVGLSGLLMAAGVATARVVAVTHIRWRDRLSVAAASLGLLVAVSGWGSWQPNLESHGNPMSVTVVQGSVPTWLYLTSTVSAGAAHLVEARYFDLIEQALMSDTDVVLVPESALHRRISVDDQRTHDLLFRVPSVQDDGPLPAVLTGAYREVVGDFGQLDVYNSVLLFDGDDPSQIIDWVDKRLLAPVTESSTFRRGEGDGLISVAGANLGILICYESMYPQISRDLVGEASILAILTNDGGFRLAPVSRTHALQGLSRAIETGRPMVRAAQSGISFVTDETGHVIAEMSSFDVGLLSAELQPMSGSTWFTAGGYLLGLLAVVASLVWVIVLAIARRSCQRNSTNVANIKP